MHKWLGWVICAGSLVALAAPASAQVQTGSILVKGVDEQGAVLPGVNVSIASPALVSGQTTGTTDASGAFRFLSLPPGVYSATLELQGFQTIVRENIVVSVGQTTPIELTLRVASVSETVTVTGESPIVDMTSKEVGGNITARELVELPSINRNFIGFVGLLPGIIPTISTESFGSDSVNVNGLDARNNNYLLDGANNNDDAIGQRAGTQARTPLESIQEFQVLTNQFDAEFGRTNGAVINAVTKQGTNTLRGSVFSYFQDAGLTKRDYFAIKNDYPARGEA